MLARYALLLPLLIALPVNAGTRESVAVAYADLNLASAQGQAMLEHRIESAVRRVCDANDSRELAMRAASRKCQLAARSVARPSMEVAVQRAAATSEVAGIVAAARQ